MYPVTRSKSQSVHHNSANTQSNHEWAQFSLLFLYFVLWIFQLFWFTVICFLGNDHNTLVSTWQLSSGEGLRIQLVSVLKTHQCLGCTCLVFFIREVLSVCGHVGNEPCRSSREIMSGMSWFLNNFKGSLIRYDTANNSNINLTHPHTHIHTKGQNMERCQTAAAKAWQPLWLESLQKIPLCGQSYCLITSTLSFAKLCSWLEKPKRNK